VYAGKRTVVAVNLKRIHFQTCTTNYLKNTVQALSARV